MDLSTHLITGVMLGAGLSKGKTHSRSIAASVITGSMAPDVDAILYLFNSRLYWEYHRTYTHNLLAVIILSFIISYTVFLKGSYKEFWNLFGYAVIGNIVHIIFDAITRYGIKLFYPFLDANHSLGIMGFHNPFIKISSAVSLILIIILPSYYAEKITEIWALVILVKLTYNYFSI